MKSRSCRPTGSELQELVMHFSVYCGWLLGRQLDDVLVEVADELGVVT
jgi:4-carboxymuconolactone decarboxylase